MVLIVEGKKQPFELLRVEGATVLHHVGGADWAGDRLGVGQGHTRQAESQNTYKHDSYQKALHWYEPPVRFLVAMWQQRSPSPLTKGSIPESLEDVMKS